MELPLTSFMASRQGLCRLVGAFYGRPIWEWSNEEVNLWQGCRGCASFTLRWIHSVNNGLFKYLVLPPRITGAMLLQLSSQGLAELFEMSLRAARGEGEGEAWNEALAQDVGLRVGKLLFAAARREAARWAAEGHERPEGLNLQESIWGAVR